MLGARISTILVSLIASASATASGLPRVSAKLLPSDRPQAFGTSIALSGHRALVGAPQSPDGTTPGSAYVFDFNGSTWAERAKLVASDGQPNDYFGNAVAVSGDIAAVAAPDADTSRGYVYVFRFDGTTWTQETKLAASDGAPRDMFGSSVAASGNIILVGAQNNSERGTAAGAVYAFRFDGSTWVEEAKILASDTSASHTFGSSVAISDDTAVIGAPGNDAAYVFRFDQAGWVEQANLRNRITSPWDPSRVVLGSAVAIYGDTALVSTWGPPSVRSAYSFRFDGASWSQGTTFGGAQFALWEDLAALTPSGSVVLFRQAGSELRLEAQVSGFDTGSAHYKTSIALSADTMLVGTPLDDALGTDVGAASVFDLTDADGDGYLSLVDTCPSVSDPTQPDTDQNGVGDVCNEAEDGDGDEWADLLDNSPDLPNPGQEDRDGDRVGDLTDPFPDDPRTEQAVAFLYETQMSHDTDLDQLQSDVNQLFFSHQEQGTVIDSLLASIEALQSQVQVLEGRIAALEGGSPPQPDCSDGMDNDGDGRTDHPADRQCGSPDDPSELAPPAGRGCGLGFELAFLLPPLMWLHRRRRHSAR